MGPACASHPAPLPTPCPAVKIWDLRAPGCQREYESRAAVNTVVLHPNQGELISGDQHGNIRVWDLTANACRWVLVGAAAGVGPHCQRMQMGAAGAVGTAAARWCHPLPWLQHPRPPAPTPHPPRSNLGCSFLHPFYLPLFARPSPAPLSEPTRPVRAESCCRPASLSTASLPTCQRGPSRFFPSCGSELAFLLSLRPSTSSHLQLRAGAGGGHRRAQPDGGDGRVFGGSGQQQRHLLRLAGHARLLPHHPLRAAAQAQGAPGWVGKGPGRCPLGAKLRG